MDNVLAFKKAPIPFKSLHCKQCGSHKFSALQDQSTIKLQLWCAECWTISDTIELKDTNGK
jgi:hypothetical protein